MNKICEMPAEFPSINRLREGKGATKAYFSANTQPDEGGWYRALMKLDLASGQHEICDFGRDSAVHEAVFVPKHPDGSGAEDDGWLINLVHRGPERETEANVLDARCIADGPVATIKLRENTGVTFHGVWVPA
jgi:all-trans-8'-apo-beta-carotenal 15,15'-oxygenase